MSVFNSRPGQLLGTANTSLPAVAPPHQGTPVVAHSRPERPARPVHLPAMTGASAKEIKVRVGRTLVIFLVDDSGSMYGRYADPTGITYAAALSVAKLMDRSGGGRAGLIHWGSEAPMEMVLRPVEVRRRRRAIKSAMIVPPTLGGTNLAAALTRAAEITPAVGKDELPLYYVLTDGCEPVTPAIHAAVAALAPGSIHVLLVDRCGYCDASLEAAWATCAFGSWTRLETFNTAEMASQIAQIFATSIGLQIPTQTTTTTTNHVNQK